MRYEVDTTMAKEKRYKGGENIEWNYHLDFERSKEAREYAVKLLKYYNGVRVVSVKGIDNPEAKDTFVRFKK